MTELETGIINLLRNDARISIEDIAASLKSESKTIEKTIKLLEDNGVILRYTALINEDLVEDSPFSIRALVEISVSPEKKTGYDAIAKRIYHYPNVTGLYLLSGQYDFLVVVEGSSHKDISAFVFDKLATLKNVTHTNTHFMFRKYKENGVIMDDNDIPDRMVISA